MLDRLKKAARRKLQRALAEVVDEKFAHSHDQQRALHAENIDALDKLLDTLSERISAVSDSLTGVHDRLAELEFRVRRDLSYAQDVAVAQESAAFVREHMPKAAVFWHPHDTLRFALGEIKGPGLALEFGVATGTTLAIIAEAVSSDRTVVGFDTFTGLPETWRTGFPAGLFAQETLPTVPGAELVAGLFDDTLPEFLARDDQPIAFMHLDADLYSSTKTVLDLAGDRLASGAVVVLDEFFNYPGWQVHEYRAWTEFIAKTGRRFDYLAYTGNSEQVVVRLH